MGIWHPGHTDSVYATAQIQSKFRGGESVQSLHIPSPMHSWVVRNISWYSLPEGALHVHLHVPPSLDPEEQT